MSRWRRPKKFDRPRRARRRQRVPRYAATADASRARPAAQPAEEARTLVAGHDRRGARRRSARTAAVGLIVTYGSLRGRRARAVRLDLAEHGRNLARDPRASLVVGRRRRERRSARARPRDARRPREPARAASRARRPRRRTSPRVPRPRCTPTSATSRSGSCGSSACAGSAATAGWTPPTATDYAAAEADPVAPRPPAPSPTSTPTTPTRCSTWRSAIAGYPDATAARCTRADRYGLDLCVDTPRGGAPAPGRRSPSAVRGRRPARRDRRARRRARAAASALSE